MIYGNRSCETYILFVVSFPECQAITVLLRDAFVPHIDGGTFLKNWCYTCKGRDSVVGIATRYGLDGPGIESRWGRDFSQPSRPALGPTQPPINGYWFSFPGVKRPGRGVDHPI
jgi:hypothetical protein